MGYLGGSQGSSPRMRLFSDAMNVLKSFIGSNYLVMPFAYAKAGLVLGTVALVGIAWITDRCCTTLVACKRRTAADRSARSGEDESDLLGSMTYGEVAREAFGVRAERVVDGALAFTQTGFCIQYFIYVVTSLKGYFPDAPLAALAAVPFAFLLPTALLPSVAALSSISAVANAAIMVGFFGVAFYDMKTPSNLDFAGAPLANWREFPIFFSIVMACFEGIGTVLPVEAGVSGHRRF